MPLKIIKFVLYNQRYNDVAKLVKNNYKYIVISNKSIIFATLFYIGLRSDARVAEEARLESVYTPKAYPEFESRSLR